MKNCILVALSLMALASAPVSRLELDHQPFVDEFREAEGRVRLVTVLSPT